MENCNLCPRKCNVNRETNLGYCKMKNQMRIAKVMLHHFEEPPISGDPETGKGSGAIFFVGCSLGCVYCQNHEISSGDKNTDLNAVGKAVSPTQLADIFKKLETVGAYNINLVTPTHFTDQIIEALKIYKPNIPIVWNTSGYECEETIKKLKGYVDIFLADFKYFDENNAKKYSFSSNYPENCKKSLKEMKKQQPNDIFENGLMKKGLIIRHLVLPGLTNDSKNIIDWINENLSNKTYFSLMAQYVPVANAKNLPEINRKITPLEYKILCKKLSNLGFENAFLQDLESAECVYTPNFSNDEWIDF